MQTFEDILEYIPQRPPFVMVDGLTSVSDTNTVSYFTIRQDNLLCENGFFYESGLIENIAQTVAAGAGYHIRNNGKEPNVAMIGSVKKLKIETRPSIGNLLTTEIKLETEIENAKVIEGAVFCNNKLIAQCQMNIFIIKNTEETQA
jgi:predicted hotdog family 3-hydroxylacyl-ACP dehydratase